MKRLVVLVLVLLLGVALWVQTRAAASFESLTEGQHLEGFRTAAVYLGAGDTPFGARFVHATSGFTLDVLTIQSVAQTMLCVMTYPTSDMGEPHTQEHLLLGKGNRGRQVASSEAMALVESTAFVNQSRTCYAFNTIAGADVFFEQFESRLDALLYPDYTDEEVRREVRNFGVVERGGLLGLDEQGTVYQEMVSSTDQPGSRIYRAALQAMYGAAHPLSFNPGGTPEALRALRPDDIRAFHADHYHLANMTAVVSVPRGMAIDDVLARFDRIFAQVEPESPRRPVRTAADLPPPDPGDATAVRIVDYPYASDQQAGAVWLAWPGTPDLDLVERTLLELFLEAMAGDPTTNLYKRFIDSRTREIELGAQGVVGSLLNDEGAVVVAFSGVPVTRMNATDLAAVRARVQQEIRLIAAWEDGSADLREFHDRLRRRLIESRRRLSTFVNAPPRFGARSTPAAWVSHLHRLERAGGFRRSVTLTPVLEAVASLLEGPQNPWPRLLGRWNLLDATPYVLAARPSPEAIARAARDRNERIAQEIASLRSRFETDEDQEALRRYGADYQAGTIAIEATAAAVTPPRFIERPPLTLDDQLEYAELHGPRGIPLVASTFDSMTGATTGLALRLDGLAEEQLVYLAALPQLLTLVGVIDAGRPVSFEEMLERQREEILRLDARFNANPATGRVELVVRGGGTDATESRRALEWLHLVLSAPDWRPENLPRIRDVLDQRFGTLLRTTQTSEEVWVRDVANAYWRQDHPVFLTATSFMTQAHLVHRLRWRLIDGEPAARQRAVAVLRDAAALRGSRATYTARLREWEDSSDGLLRGAARDLAQLLDGVPDSSLHIDWPRLAGDMAADLEVGPEAALEALERLRREVSSIGHARLFLVSSSGTRDALMPAIVELADSLEEAAAPRQGEVAVHRIVERLRQREPEALAPVFVGLLHPSAQSGVFVNSAPLTGYGDTDREALLDYLAANLYGGGGSHSIFMRTWGAGLAYSNGIGPRASDGRLGYYAERTPELPQTMRFVIAELERAEPDPALVEYAIAGAFREARGAGTYEDRAERMADDLADGIRPEIVQRFRRAVLELRHETELAHTLHTRMSRVYASVLPGMDPQVPGVDDALYFVIGPERQMAAWEAYLRAIYQPDIRVFRLYSRDFWL